MFSLVVNFDSLGARILGNYAPQLWNVVPNEIKRWAVRVIGSRPGQGNTHIGTHNQFTSIK